MDMYHLPEPGPKPGSSDWNASLPVLVVAIAAWAMLSVWSISFVAHSILAAGVVPPDTAEWQVFGLAAGLQACVGLLGLVTSLFFRPFRLLNASLWVFCLAACLTVVGFESFHQIFRGLQLSTGANFERSENTQVERIEAEISNLSGQIPVLYQDKLQALEKSIQNAKDGRDRTGLQGCGDICKGRTALYEQAAKTFNYLARNTVPPPGGKSDVRARVIDSRYRFGSLKANEASLIDFYRAIDRSTPPRQITDAIAQLREALEAKEREYAGVSVIDAKNIAMVRTGEALASLLDGRAPRQDVWLAMAYGCLPAIAITALGIFIRLIFDARRQPVELLNLHRELTTEEQAAPMLRKLAQLRSGNFLQRLRAGFRRWDLYWLRWQRQARDRRQESQEPAIGDG